MDKGGKNDHASTKRLSLRVPPDETEIKVVMSPILGYEIKKESLNFMNKRIILKLILPFAVLSFAAAF
jgi:hypothetical protein